VQPELADVYDGQSRPTWAWRTPEITVTETRRSITCPAGTDEAFLRATVTPLYPPLVPGTRLTITRDDGFLQEPLTFIGYDNEVALLSGIVRSAFTGEATSTFRNQTVFELAPVTLVRSLVRDPAVAAARQLVLINAAGFPPRGRISIILGGTGNTVFSDYSQVSGNVLIGLDADLVAIPANSTVSLLAEYAERLPSTAYSAAVQQSRSDVVGNGSLTADELAAIYPVIAANTVVIETGAVGQPGGLKALLDDCLPAHGRYVLQFRHVQRDDLPLGMDDGTESLHEVTIGLLGGLTPAVAPVGFAWNVPSYTASVHLAASVTPTGAFPGEVQDLTYKWKMQVLSGESTGVALANTTAPSTTLVGLTSGMVCRITLQVLRGYRRWETYTDLTVN
jgi:hypothetical protein